MQEQNGTNVNSVAPSSEELWVSERNLMKTPDYSPWFSAKTGNLDFGGKLYHRKGLFKRAKMAQISAP